MSKRSFLQFLLFLFLVLSFLSFGQFVSADQCRQGETQNCGTCGVQRCECSDETVETPSGPITVTVCDWGDCDETSKPDNHDEETWKEYRCQAAGCGQQYIEKRTCSHFRTRSVTCKGNGVWRKGSWSSWSTPECNTPSVIENCELDWQLCSGSNQWSKSTRSCDCAGTCLEAPKNPRYYNNPDYPTNPYEPEESENANNIFLPVKLDWDNVKAWKNGWEEDGEIKECSEDCFQSYLIGIDNTPIDNFSKALTQDSEYNPTQDQGACFLKSGITHNWNVSACCNADGTNCGSKSEWDFRTNSAPEPVLPADPDWEEKEIKPGVEIPVFLDWCDVNNAQSFRVKIHYIKDDQELCHPWLVSEQSCSSKIITTKKRPPPYPSEEMLYSNFRDEEGYFTKDTEYRWELATCVYDDGTGCGDFGQKWGFKTALVSLDEFKLISPQNDPAGNTPVGLPLTLDWETKTGMNSFIYEINPGDITRIVTSSQADFDYPILSLDSFYKWRIKPCWDYEGKECEENWSEEWTFKTTGASPNLISPESNTSNIPIPIKLEWENMSGAKSYKYWLYSNGQLITSGASTENSVLVKYDPVLKEPKQETDYSWQIATCADEEGKICGLPTSLWKFTTFKLSSSLNLLPENNETIFTYQMPKSFSWDSNAKYFRFILNYIEKAEQEVEDCPLGRQEKIIDNSFYSLSLNCLGEYQWQVQACLDENCDQEGTPSPIRNFTLDQTTPPTQFGLVPCGRSSDNPDTPWNERDSCQFKHLFILFKNILDFLLWRVTLIILLLLVIATAIIFYFSIGAPALVIDIRGVWRAAGKGYAIIFLSWIIINLVLNILGYQVGIFGNWWQINF